jgi:hypothetical protein
VDKLKFACAEVILLHPETGHLFYAIVPGMCKVLLKIKIKMAVIKFDSHFAYACYMKTYFNIRGSARTIRALRPTLIAEPGR